MLFDTCHDTCFEIMHVNVTTHKYVVLGRYYPLLIPTEKRMASVFTSELKRFI